MLKIKEKRRRFTRRPELNEETSSKSLCSESVKEDSSEVKLDPAESEVLASTVESDIGQSVI